MDENHKLSEAQSDFHLVCQATFVYYRMTKKHLHLVALLQCDDLAAERKNDLCEQAKALLAEERRVLSQLFASVPAMYRKLELVEGPPAKALRARVERLVSCLQQTENTEASVERTMRLLLELMQ